MSIVETPLMKQYLEIKQAHPDAILLFRVGDFYETFGEDAVFTAKALNIVLTRRANGSASFVELAGFPYHALDTYLHKLVQAGAKVAICEQLEDPKMTKKLVKRGVSELITPGVAYNDKLLENASNNFLSALHILGKEIGISFLDVSTGQFYLAQGNKEYVKKLLQNFKPSELIIQKNQIGHFSKTFGDNYYITSLEDWVFKSDFAHEILCKHFQTHSLKGFGIEELSDGIIAAAACLHYLSITKHEQSPHINKISKIEEKGFVWLDAFSMRNLELLSPLQVQGKSLLGVLNKTLSPMGGRLLKRYVALPLYDLDAIEKRFDQVSFLCERLQETEFIRALLSRIGDMERLLAKIAVCKAQPREIEQLKNTLKILQEIQAQKIDHPQWQSLIGSLDICEDLSLILDKSLIENPPISFQKGPVMAKGLNKELDELRLLSGAGKEYLVQIQQKESEKTGISSLKLGFNNVFGYYLEVTHVHKDKVPVEWIRKQTLSNAERYITPEIKDYEQKILYAEERILVLETQLFQELLQTILTFIERLQQDARLLAHLDVMLSFAKVSIENNYVRPLLDLGDSLEIIQGRHPVIEKNLPPGQSYVPNDVFLDRDTQQILMITGPNMSGKSAVLRQTALIVLMAQMGCFVPAFEAKMGLIDKVFTRVGASDDISSGESTFMVEMNETANILHNISDKSLLLLDEIGRGTSTYDGISIAWAIAEYLHEYAGCRPKVLFATHYHELNAMEESFSRLKNFHISIREVDNKILFLRNLIPGGSEHSFGIHVARMAGMPQQVLQRAEDMMLQLEQSREGSATIKAKEQTKLKNSSQTKPAYQLSFIQLDDPLLSELKDEILHTDIERLSPIEALNILHNIQKKLKP